MITFVQIVLKHLITSNIMARIATQVALEHNSCYFVGMLAHSGISTEKYEQQKQIDKALEP
jgi:hypothetical protein